MSYALGDMVKVTNHGTRPVKVGWDGRWQTIEPEKSVFCLAEAVNVAFGDPRSTESARSYTTAYGDTGTIPSRSDEIKRLRVLYGGGSLGSDADFELVDIPNVEVHSLEGDRVFTVLDDPSGETVTQATSTIAESNDLVAIVQRQQRQIELLLAETGIDEKAHASEEELPTDESTIEGNLKVKNLLSDEQTVHED